MRGTNPAASHSSDTVAARNLMLCAHGLYPAFGDARVTSCMCKRNLVHGQNHAQSRQFSHVNVSRMSNHVNIRAFWSFQSDMLHASCTNSYRGTIRQPRVIIRRLPLGPLLDQCLKRRSPPSPSSLVGLARDSTNPGEHHHAVQETSPASAVVQHTQRIARVELQTSSRPPCNYRSMDSCLGTPRQQKLRTSLASNAHQQPVWNTTLGE